MNKFLYCLKKQNLEYFSTLKETSYDEKNDIYLCNSSTEEVINFDKLVKTKYPNKQPSSVDAILIYPSEKEIKLYLIEFKNQLVSQIENNKVREKLINSISVLKDIFIKCNISFNPSNLIYCVVYKKDKTNKWRRGIERNIIRFGLEKFKGKFVNDIFTNDIEWMTKEYNKIFEKKLIC